VLLLLSFLTVLNSGCGGDQDAVVSAPAGDAETEGTADVQAGQSDKAADGNASDAGQAGGGSPDASDEIAPSGNAAGNAGNQIQGLSSNTDDKNPAGVGAGNATEVTNVGVANAGVSDSAVPAVVPRGADVSAWTETDFETAVRERDARVVDAIDTVVGSKPNDVSVAKLLTRLLAVSLEQTSAVPNGRQPFGSSGGTVNSPTATGNSGGAGNASEVLGRGNASEATGSGNRSEETPSRSRGKRGDDDDDQSLLMPARNPAKALISQLALICSIRLSLSSTGILLLEKEDTVPGSEPGVVGDGSGGDDEGMFSGGGNSPGQPPQNTAFPEMDLKVFVERVVSGLMDNNTEESWQTVRSILTQEIRTPLNDDETCSVVVFSLLRRLQTSQTTVVPVLNSLLDGSLNLPKENRVRVLKIMTSVSAAATDRLTGLGSKRSSSAGAPGVPSGSGAVISLREGRRSDDDDFQSPPSAASPAVSVTPLPVVDLDDAAILRAAAFLWSPVSVQNLVSKLQQTDDAALAFDLLNFCATIPLQSSRKGVYGQLMKAYAANDEKYLNSGLFDEYLHDPGMLVILKSLPRSRSVSRSRSDKQAPDSWTQAAGKAVLRFRDQLRIASGTLPDYEGQPAVKVHKGATLEKTVMISLPSDAVEFPAEARPADTNIYYTRAKFSPTNAKEQSQIVDHYEERTGAKRRYDPQRQITWFDGIKAQSGGKRRSVDVVIQAAGFGAPIGGPGGNSPTVGAGNAGMYTVEVIVVEIADVRDTGSGPKTADNGR
jgi:hypothetical protein